jgi:dTDP-4-dehydrorhamnose 3,5-epimerase-like enzyme
VAELIRLKSYRDARGLLTIVQDELPFEIKRTYYIQHVPSQDIVRGGHRHKTATQGLVCIAGSCEIYNNDGEKEESFLLDDPSKCLLLSPKDWHTMQKFTADAILLVFASTKYDVNDYIDEPYSH